MVVKLERVVEANNVLQDAVSAGSRNNERGALDALEAKVIEYIVKAIDRLASMEPLGPRIAQLFSPITKVLADLAGDPTAIYEHCAALDRQASALTEMPATLRAAVQDSQQAWSDSKGADSFRLLTREYSELFPMAADVLKSQSALVNQTAVYVVKTKVAIMNLVGQLVWDLIAFAAKIALMPWKLLTAVADATRIVLSVLYKVRDFANTLAAEGNKLLGHQAGLGRAMQRAGELLSAPADQAAPRPFDEHGPGFTEDMRSDGPNKDDDLMSDLIAGADGKGDMPPGWSQLGKDELRRLGIDMDERDGDGFGGQVLRGPNGQLVVKFDGTDFSYAPDVIEDGVGGVTMSQQSKRAMEVAEAIRKAGHGDNVVYTGNSLGGRLAAVAALSSGGVAVSFNAAGVSPGTLEYLAAQRGMSVEELRAEANSGSVRRYYLDGEILTTLQEKTPITRDLMPDAPGQVYKVPNTEQTEGMSPVQKHIANGQIGDAMRRNWPQMR